MRAAPLLLLLGSAIACADSSEDGANGQGQDLTTLNSLKCRSGSTTFDIKPDFGGSVLGGTLTLASGQSSEFVCRAGTGQQVLGCKERPQEVHPGRWTVDVTKTGESYEATLKKGGEADPDLTMTCTAPSHGDGGAVPTYAQVKPIIDSKCNGCHNGAFDTLEKVNAARKVMLGMITAGLMPRRQPTWKDSEDGKKVIDFLQNSPELQ